MKIKLKEIKQIIREVKNELNKEFAKKSDYKDRNTGVELFIGDIDSHKDSEDEIIYDLYFQTQYRSSGSLLWCYFFKLTYFIENNKPHYLSLIYKQRQFEHDKPYNERISLVYYPMNNKSFSGSGITLDCGSKEMLNKLKDEGSELPLGGLKIIDTYIKSKI